MTNSLRAKIGTEVSRECRDLRQREWLGVPE